MSCNVTTARSAEGSPATRMAWASRRRSSIVRIVRREIDGLAEAAGKARIGINEAAHLVAVTRNDHDDAVAVVFHEFEQRIDRLLAEVAADGAGAGEGIGLVDEED